MRLWENIYSAIYGLSELISNAIDWGGGIKEIKIYFGPKGIVLILAQAKAWDYGDALSKVMNGLHPSRRGGGERTMDVGGAGLYTVKNAKYEVSYTAKLTIILLKTDYVKRVLKIE